MGLWAEQVVPRVVEKALGGPEQHRLRAQVCAGLVGEVVELGFGSGHNVRHYPPGVTRVHAVEPSDVAWQRSGRRRARSSVPVVRAGLDGQRLPFPDASLDSALSTWTLCTVPDAGAALREVARVLRPGGRLHLVEHGLAQDAGVARAQRLLEPLQRRLFAGCHLTRRIDLLLAEAGLPAARLERRYAAGEPRVFGALYLGTSVPAGRTPGLLSPGGRG